MGNKLLKKKSKLVNNTYVIPQQQITGVSPEMVNPQKVVALNQPQVPVPSPQYPPQVVAPIPAPQIVAPIPAPQVVAPVPAPQVVAPIPAPQVVAPIPAPQVVAPIPAPVPTVVVPGGVQPLQMIYGVTYLPDKWFPIDLPRLCVGLGWDFEPGYVYDLDASVTGLNNMVKIVDTVYFKRLGGLFNSVELSGDNLTGKGEGDDEEIIIDLTKLPKHVTILAICLHSYKQNSMKYAKNAFIRVYEPTSQREIGRYNISHGIDCIGLLFGLMYKSKKTGRWFLRVMTDPLPGNVIIDSQPTLKQIIPKYIKTFNDEVVE